MAKAKDKVKVEVEDTPEVAENTDHLDLSLLSLLPREEESVEAAEEAAEEEEE
jgi:hypothetical protein